MAVIQSEFPPQSKIHLMLNKSKSSMGNNVQYQGISLLFMIILTFANMLDDSTACSIEICTQKWN